MPKPRGARRTFLFALLAVCGAFVGIPCGAADSPASPAAQAPPSTLTPASARDLLSRMSDTEVRKITWENASRLFRHAVPESMQVPAAR